MRVAAVSMVKNECDVIELFVRINARVVDHFFVLEDGSSDATPEILRRLRNEGYPITVWPRRTVGYEQAAVTMDAVRKVSRLSFDYVMPLDADEFVSGELKRELAALPAETYGKLMLRSFVPLSDCYYEADAPLWSVFRPRAREPVPAGKVVLSRALARRAVLHMGNHEAYHRSGRQLPSTVLAARLDHVPVRSAAQLVTKVLIGVHNASLRPRRAGQLRHWEAVADDVRAHRYRLDAATLRRLAFRYTAPGSADTELSEGEGGVGTASDVIRYPELARIDPVERFDGFTEALCRRLRREQHPALSGVREALLALAARSRRKLGWL